MDTCLRVKGIFFVKKNPKKTQPLVLKESHNLSSNQIFLEHIEVYFFVTKQHDLIGKYMYC